MRTASPTQETTREQKKNYYGEVIVPCRWCAEMTNMTTAKECDRCWQLRSAIVSDPQLVRRMFNELRKEHTR